MNLTNWLILAGCLAGHVHGSSGAPSATTSAAVLVDFEVTQPVVVPASSNLCTLTLMEHEFGNSFGMPFVGRSTVRRSRSVLNI
jgi:hypothetical protein